MPSIQKIIEAGNAGKKNNKSRKFCVVMVIKAGYISREFLVSLCDVLQSTRQYTLHTYTCDTGYLDDGVRAFCERSDADAIIFVQTMVGFTVDAINALVADCHELTDAQTCVAVPREERSFGKVLSSVKRLGVDSFDERALESLTSIFDIDVKNNKIHLDDKGRFECEGFQPHDIVCVPLATVRENVTQANVKKLVHTRFTTSNRDARGCLLDHLKVIQL